MTRKEKLLTVIAAAELVLCFLLVLIIGLEVKRPLVVNLATEKSGYDIELMDAFKAYCDTQTAYYEYNLAGLKACDEARGDYYSE